MTTSAAIKCMVVGDEETGKIKLLQSMCKITNPAQPNQRTIYEGHPLSVSVDNVKSVIALWDTSGQEEYETLRQASYYDVDLFLVCFSIAQRSTFISVQDMWLPEVLTYSKGAPILLVGTKLEQRHNHQGKVTQEDGHTLLAGLDCRCQYLECSYKTLEGINTLIEEMAREGRLWKRTSQWQLSRTCKFL